MKKLCDMKNSSWQFKNFADCNIQNYDLEGSSLYGANFRDADLTGSNLTGTDLQNVDFRGANLTDVIFSQATLTGADLRGAKIDGVNFSNANIKGAKFSPKAKRKSAITKKLIAQQQDTDIYYVAVRENLDEKGQLQVDMKTITAKPEHTKSMIESQNSNSPEEWVARNPVKKIVKVRLSFDIN